MPETATEEEIVLSAEEAMRIANWCEGEYTTSREDAYNPTNDQAARDAMMIRDRAGIEPNPNLLVQERV